MVKLTKRVVDALEAGEKDRFEWDDELPGFGVRVWPTGRKTYVAQYRVGKQTRRFKIGTHGALTVEEARKQAKIVLGDVARGEDPQLDRSTKRKAMTVRELCEQYFEAADHGLILGKRGQPKKVSTLYVDRGRVNRHIVPLLGNRLVQDISTADVVKMMRDVASGKTAMTGKSDKPRGRIVVEGGPGTAGQSVTILSAILTFGVEQGIVGNNVARGIRKPAVGRRLRRLDAAEYRKLGEALDAADDLAWQGVTGARLVLLSGCRLNEIARLKWSEVDEAGSCLRLEDSKTGASIRPVGREFLQELGKVRKDPKNAHVLTSDRKGGSYYQSLDTVIDKLAKRAGLEDVSAHTLRHSYASVAGDLGFTEITISALLGHAAGGVTQRYVHHLDAVLIAAANKVCAEIHRLLTGKTADVIELPRRA